MAGRTARVMTPQDQELGARVRQARKNYGMTQLALADRAGISTQTLNFLEKGHIKSPSVATIRAIADVLGVSIDALAGRQPARRQVEV